MEAPRQGAPHPTPAWPPTFYVKCVNSIAHVDGFSQVTFIGTSPEMTSTRASAIWPASLAIQAIEQFGVRFRCPDRQMVVYVDLVVGLDLQGVAYLKAIVDRDEPLTLLTMRNRNAQTETHIISKVTDALV